jgi:hypothetical protein
MKRKRYSVEQIVAAVQQHGAVHESPALRKAQGAPRNWRSKNLL